MSCFGPEAKQPDQGRSLKGWSYGFTELEKFADRRNSRVGLRNSNVYSRAGLRNRVASTAVVEDLKPIAKGYLLLRQEIVQETLYLPLPEISEINAVFESNGSLYCMFFGESRTGNLEIWAMKYWESPNHWTEEITVSLDTYYKFVMPYAPLVRPLGMTADANRLNLSVQQHQQMLTQECKLVTLDLRSKELKDIICGAEDDPELGSEAEETFCIKSWPHESGQYFIGSLVKLPLSSVAN
ncbi:hypothetical protein AKJ16_DCAP03099 [Drosera capensis]